MLEKSSFCRSAYCAWELLCDHPLPGASPMPDSNNKADDYAINPLYLMPLWAAATGIAAMVAGWFLSQLLPVNGTAIVFAILLTAASELRTSARGLSLSVTFFENIFYGKKFAEAQMLRQSDLKNVGGLVPLLLAIGLLAGKFAAVYLAARNGHFGVATAAWVVAATAEGVMASEPAAVNVPAYCRQVRGEYLVAVGGFFLLFNLFCLPLPTLIATGATAAAAVILLNLALRRSGRVDPNDMTMTGYLLEFLVWTVFAIMIG